MPLPEIAQHWTSTESDVNRITINWNKFPCNGSVPFVLGCYCVSDGPTPFEAKSGPFQQCLLGYIYIFQISVKNQNHYRIRPISSTCSVAHALISAQPHI